MSNQLAARGIQTLKIRDKDRGEFVIVMTGYFFDLLHNRDVWILSLEFQFVFPTADAICAELQEWNVVKKSKRTKYV